MSRKTELSTHHRAVSDTVRILMSRHEETVSGLARDLGDHQPNVSAKLGGRRGWHMDDLWALAEHYKMSPTEFLATIERTRAATEQITAPENG
ncbi:hypothetical protein SAMN05421803_1494 [Nocardiopsis flavescens]|uniref:BetR domain-containing protein n=1 Tax=Nocardiopsis flavescens TaxID=758803 RepID=A0A1M6WQN9_9ACTN|nr:hypothetical protein [Nocardiopsis flavescens]SHK95991.1 hypothetical protein SAMN05421803_1494 [Nocardiopsis flavescens]